MTAGGGDDEEWAEVEGDDLLERGSKRKVASILEGLALFSNFSIEEVNQISGFSEKKRYRKHEVVFSYGERAAYVFILLEGSVLLHLPAKPEEFRIVAWREVLDVNLTGAFLCARAVVPGMKRRRRGRIVNVASISGTVGTERASAYNASKWGLIGLTKCLAEELRPHGIQCMSVSPGSVDTEMLAKTPFRPEMQPDDVAGVVVWAALEAPDAVTGANLEVYG